MILHVTKEHHYVSPSVYSPSRDTLIKRDLIRRRDWVCKKAKLNITLFGSHFVGVAF